MRGSRQKLGIKIFFVIQQLSMVSPKKKQLIMVRMITFEEKNGKDDEPSYPKNSAIYVDN